MNQILYLTENKALKTIDFDGTDIQFKEKAFIISVIWDGNVLTARLDGLTALEKYAMNANGFDYLILTAGDYRLENSTFSLPDNWATTSLPASGTIGGNNGGGGSSSASGVSPFFPVYKNGLQSIDCIILSYNNTSQKWNASVEDYALMSYVFNPEWEYPNTMVFGCLYFVSKYKMPDNVYIYLNPKTGEFCFYDFGEWVEIFSNNFSTWGNNSGNIRVFRHITGNDIFISTTPIDNSIITVV